MHTYRVVVQLSLYQNNAGKTRTTRRLNDLDERRGKGGNDMEVLKEMSIVDVRLTAGELTVLINLHQELVDRGMCANARVGHRRDLTELGQYLRLLPEGPQGERGRRTILISDAPSADD